MPDAEKNPTLLSAQRIKSGKSIAHRKANDNAKFRNDDCGNERGCRSEVVVLNL